MKSGTLLVMTCAGAAALALGACGERSEPGAGGAGTPVKPEKFTLILDYFPNADHAGIYAAQAAGYFKEAGLEVDVQAPPDPSAPLKLLQAGRADLAVSYEPELLLAREQGTQLLSVAALVQVPLTSIISLAGKDPVRTPADLRGAKVGTAGIPYQSSYLKTIAKSAGIAEDDVDEVNVGFDLTPALISGRVKATLGSFWNYEGVDLQRRNRDPVILRMEQLGVPTYNELILVARRKDLDTGGASRVRRFLAALARGHDLLRKDPTQALDALLEANDELDRGLQEAVIEATTPVFFPADEKRPWGYQDAQAWRRYGEWMQANGLVKQPPRADDALTNEFLPGQGLGTRPPADY